MREWKPRQRPILWRTRSEYLVLSQSSIARAEGRPRSEGAIWTTSARVTWVVLDGCSVRVRVASGTYEDVHLGWDVRDAGRDSASARQSQWEEVCE